MFHFFFSFCFYLPSLSASFFMFADKDSGVIGRMLISGNVCCKIRNFFSNLENLFSLTLFFQLKFFLPPDFFKLQIFQDGKFSPTNFWYGFSNLENFLQRQIFDTIVTTWNFFSHSWFFVFTTFPIWKFSLIPIEFPILFFWLKNFRRARFLILLFRLGNFSLTINFCYYY